MTADLDVFDPARSRIYPTSETSEQSKSSTLDLDGDRLREECGVFGIFGHPDAAAITALGLHALQHRGQEAAGIVSFDGKRFHSERRMGLVGDNFSRREVIDRLPGTTAVGHVRLRAAHRDGRGVFEVEDSGPGIAPDEQGELFEPFVQTESGRQAREAPDQA